MTHFKALSSTSGLIAALSMAATPLAAAELPVQAPLGPVTGSITDSIPMTQNWDPDSEIAERHRRHRYRHRHRRGVSAGDVLTGVLIIGGIAAIASAASSDNNKRRQQVNTPRYRERNSDTRSNGTQNIDRAVNMCLSEIERNVRVEAVNTVNRTGEGWDVAGTLYNGDGFTCRINNQGRVDSVSYGAAATPVEYSEAEDRQYSDEEYAAAWDREETGSPQVEETRTAQVDVEQDGPQPAYPGGPLPGDEGYEEELRGG